MCELYSDDPAVRNMAHDRLKSLVGNLKILAESLYEVSRGRIQPHTWESESIAIKARQAIKGLAELI